VYRLSVNAGLPSPSRAAAIEAFHVGLSHFRGDEVAEVAGLRRASGARRLPFDL